MAFGRIKVGAVLERRGILLAFPVVLSVFGGNKRFQSMKMPFLALIIQQIFKQKLQ